MNVLLVEDNEPLDSRPRLSDIRPDVPGPPSDDDHEDDGEIPEPIPAWALYRDPGPAAMFP